MDQLPFVSIIMPIRNEANYIGRSLAAVLAQNYPPACMEVLVVDGMSDDNTRQIVQSTASGSHIPVIILDNPDRIVPTALNKAILQAQGEIIIRVDGHCEIALDYIQNCLAALQQSNADCVGGPMVTIGETPTAQSIALAQSSPFGVGNVAFRTGQIKGQYVDTLAFGAYRREVFDRIGRFDEELVRNQDDEFNFRLTQTGGKIWLDPTIRSIYYSRANLKKLWQQYYQYGFYKVRVIQKRSAVPAWRHLIPAMFVLSLLAGLALTLVTRRGRWLTAVISPYLTANFAATLYTGRQSPHTLPILPLAFAILHLAYGLGFLHGLWHWRKSW
jgi:glycosyltransferase involved in cell wall biosynthesis